MSDLSYDVYIPEDTDGRKSNGYIHPCAGVPTLDTVIEIAKE